GLGFIPVAPGTFGSLLGVAICYALIETLKFEPHLLLNAIIAVSVAVALIGTWASNRAERILVRKDASQIVIDEVCGQLIAYVFVAPALQRVTGDWRIALAVGFVLFRLFDIFKPWPIRRLESLGSGVGVMADDVLAGIYAAVVLSWLLLLF
ncbi:MAG: phosphatidylglycerophosphatase A, partial [Acidobacteriota bacterium]